MKPLLAATCSNVDALVYPIIASPKLDGIRCLIKDGVALSRSLKPIPNKYVQSWVSSFKNKLDGLDGELIIGKHDEEVFRRTTSGVMSIEGEPDFTYCVFDCWGSSKPYRARLRMLHELLHSLNKGKPTYSYNRIRLVPTSTIICPDDLLEYEAEALRRGYEGVMVRDPDGGYKHGRSTEKEATLLKLKRFVDCEGVVKDTYERLHNQNEAKTNALGNTERSTHKAGKVAAGDLGGLVVQLEGGVTTDVGSGFTAQERKTLWKQRAKLIGKVVKIKYFPMGGKDKPRFPVFCGFRSEIDL